jgi:chromate transporter
MAEPEETPQAPIYPERGSLREVGAVFLKLGVIAFGGPAAHVALMRQELVQRRKWLTDQRFLDLFGAANLIPGPSSTELAIFLGYVRAGWPALILAGVLFIAPAMLMVLAFAWLYVHLGHFPAVGWLLYGIKPVIIAIIAQALYGLGRTALKGPLPALLGVAVLGLYFLGVNVILLLFGGAILYALFQNARRLRAYAATAIAVPSAGVPFLGSLLGATAPTGASVGLLALFLAFLKVGSVVYGSGYVLLAFLRTDFVLHLHWLTDQQLVDAVAVGQFTPGPVFTTATFLGYLFAGLPGALLATVAIFLPSFLFVALIFPLVDRLRRSPWTSAFLDGVNAAALGLMAAVALQLGKASIVDPLTAVVALVALAILLRFKPNSAWLVLGGGSIGLVSRLLVH